MKISLNINTPKEKFSDTIDRNIKAFKQQRLPAWQPLLTATTVLPSFFLLGIASIATGVGLLFISSRIQQFELDYTNCMPLIGTQSCAQLIEDNINIQCKCWYKFELKEDFYASVYIYYELTNYYQNHRLYENSKDESQLWGTIEASTDCIPFQYKVERGRQLPIVPCGTIANSLFNDTFRVWHHDLISNLALEVPLLYTGISWPSDQNIFNNPSGVSLEKAYANFTNPPFWGNRTIWQLDPNNPNNNGFKNEALMVWFRTGAFPQFRKLYARINHQIGSIFSKSLPNGHYFLEIDYNYPVISFKGSKSLVISNTSWIGGKNAFLGIAYIIFGSLLIICTSVLLFIYKRYGMNSLTRILITERTPYFSQIERRHFQCYK